jgi:hypothetical protein
LICLGYDERTWEPSRNLDNCLEKLKEYKLAVKSRRQQDEKNKESSTEKETRVDDQRVVSVKNAKTINYKKVKLFKLLNPIFYIVVF